MPEIFGFEAYSPSEIAKRVEEVGVVKARLPILSMTILGILAGVFIGIGAMFYTIVISDTNFTFAESRILGGLVFSIGLILVVVAGAELFTGNNLLAMAWAEGKLSAVEVLKNWVVVCFANFLGVAIFAFLIFNSGHLNMNNGAIENQYMKIAILKCSIPFWNAFYSGILCNILVCLAVWMSISGRSVVDKVIAIIFPISAFVAAGFEHSVANMYFIVLGIILKGQHPDFLGIEVVTIGGFFHNLVPVIIGNLIGGSGFVALVYYMIYRRNISKQESKRVQ